MNRGMGPKQMFEGKGIAVAIATGEKIWTTMFPGGNSSFPFNTACFHGSATGDDDESPPPAPGPAPAGCAAAVRAACPGETGTACMSCCQAHHATLIQACPQGAPEMREACGL